MEKEQQQETQTASTENQWGWGSRQKFREIAQFPHMLYLDKLQRYLQPTLPHPAKCKRKSEKLKLMLWRVTVGNMTSEGYRVQAEGKEKIKRF